MNKPTKEKITASTQAYLPIKEIKEGALVMHDNSLRAVIIVSSLNFALKSDEEKDAIVYSYQDFLNSLTFPIQILANSRKIDLSGYVGKIGEALKTQTNPLIKLQTQEYMNFLNELLDYADIMEKRFFVVIPFYSTSFETVGNVPNPFKKSKEPVAPFEEQKRELAKRVEIVIAGLTQVGLRCAALGTEDLLELFYSIYNPEVAPNQKVGNVQDVDIPIITQGGQSEPAA